MTVDLELSCLGDFSQISPTRAGCAALKTQQHLRAQVGMGKKNTTSRKSKSKARKSVLERINPNAAGIDIGANFHFVAIPEDRAEENVRKLRQW